MNDIRKNKKISGSEALVDGALKAGAEFYAGYPISPSSEIMEMCSKSKKMSFLQMEDEIASIHAVMGASLAGKKSWTATSGPGFTLMQEGIGMAFAMQIPLVVVNAQRQGPATGMPTIASQGDVLQTQYGTHGDFSSIVFCPNSVTEMYEYMIHAFNASEESLSPVIVLTDAFVTNLYEKQEDVKNINIVPRSFKNLTKGGTDRHWTGLSSKDNGEVDTFDSQVYSNWIGKRRNSVLKTGNRYYFYKTKNNPNSKTLIISYGITSRIVENIVNEDKSFSSFRPITLFPIKEKILKKVALKYKNIVVVEMNEGQYAGEVQKVLNREVRKIRVVGMNPSEKDILNELRKI